MKSILVITCLLALCVNKSSLMERLTAQLQGLKKKESPAGTPCEELSAPTPKYEECSLLTGRVGKMQGLKNTGPQNAPITIVSKNIYGELHL